MGNLIHKNIQKLKMSEMKSGIKWDTSFLKP